MFKPKCDWRPPSMSDLPSWKNAKRIGIDVETKDTELKKLGIGARRGGYIVGVSFAIEGGPKHYLPFRHEGGDNIDETSVLNYLRENANNFRGQLVGARLSYDLDYLWEEGIKTPNVEFYRDIQVADPLIYELENSFSLDNIAKRYGFEGKNEQQLREAASIYGVHPKSGLWQLPGRHVGEYGEDDAELPLQVLRKQEEHIEKNNLWNIWNLESQVLPVLVKMRRRGVLIDQDKLSEIEKWSLEQETEALALVKRETGIDIGVGNVWKADALAPTLEEIGIRLTKTSTGKPNIDQEVLGSVKHPVAKAIAWARKTNKLRTTFAQSIRTHMVNGRIHCTFNQIAREDEKGDQKGARYGRLSAVDPNLQQQPSRDEFADMWRSIYIPEEGAIWGCNDYSQQEPRWTTHFAALVKLPKAEAAAKRYRDDPTTDNHDLMTTMIHKKTRDEVDEAQFDKWRKHCKTIYLGLCYGEGGAKLCDDLGLSTRWALAFKGENRRRVVKYYKTQREAMEARMSLEVSDGFIWRAAGKEGQGIIDQFDAEAPFVRRLAKKATARAKKNGFITTIGGRRLHFPQRDDGSYDWVHKALNRLIQGSSADQVKIAMVAIDREMPDTFLQLQVHDETDGSYGTVEECKQVADIMQNCVTGTQVPFLVDTEIGPSWGEIK